MDKASECDKKVYSNRFWRAFYYDAINYDAIKLEETVLTMSDDKDKQLKVSNMRNIIEINHGLALKSDGTVVPMEPENFNYIDEISQWSNIIAIDGNLGLRLDGTVVTYNEKTQESIKNWKNIVVIQYNYHTYYDDPIGIKSDGTVIRGEEVMPNLNNVIQISGSLALKSNGTVVCLYRGETSEAVSYWHDIIEISPYAGLRADGKVVTTSSDERVQNEVSKWNNIIAIASYSYNTGTGTIFEPEYEDVILGLRADGTAVTTASDPEIQQEVSSWRNLLLPPDDLLNEIKERQIKVKARVEAVEAEKARERAAKNAERAAKIAKEEELLKAKRRKEGCCQYCGGSFVGIFNKVCSKCGERKDY